jgi:hypothetical protein
MPRANAKQREKLVGKAPLGSLPAERGQRALPPRTTIASATSSSGRQPAPLEEGELFPKLRKSGMDLVEVGEQLAARKKELMSQMKAAA